MRKAVIVARIFVDYMYTLRILSSTPASKDKRFDMSASTHLSITALYERVKAILLKAGVNPAQAGAVARVITAGERDACKSHGIYRIEGILRTIKAGKVKLDAVPQLLPHPGTAVLRGNAGGGFANPAFELGLPTLG